MSLGFIEPEILNRVQVETQSFLGSIFESVFFASKAIPAFTEKFSNCTRFISVRMAAFTIVKLNVSEIKVPD